MLGTRGRSGVRRGPSSACAAALAAALAVSGCGPGARIGPMRDFASCPEDLALSVRERVGSIRTLHDPDASVGSGALSGRAKLYLKGRRLFRLDVSHLLIPKVATAVLNEDGFLLVDWRKRKAFKDDIRTLLEVKLPDVKLGPDYFVVRQLFFPDLEPVSGERAVLVYGETTYTVEFWRRDRLRPVRAITVDDWSHTPTRAVFYDEDGRIEADIRWRDFEYLGEGNEELDYVAARRVTVRFPAAGKKIRFKLNEPQYNKKLGDGAFRLRVPPGVEVEDIRAEEAGQETPPKGPETPES